MFAYAIFDDKAGNYNTPFFDVNDGAAMRNFERLTLDTSSLVNFAPRDFHLYRVGQFDQASGDFKLSDDKPVFIAHAMQFINQSLVATDKPVV